MSALSSCRQSSKRVLCSKLICAECCRPPRMSNRLTVCPAVHTRSLLVASWQVPQAMLHAAQADLLLQMQVHPHVSSWKVPQTALHAKQADCPLCSADVPTHTQLASPTGHTVC